MIIAPEQIATDNNFVLIEKKKNKKKRYKTVPSIPQGSQDVFLFLIIKKV
jgi:hypothetical protein